MAVQDLIAETLAQHITQPKILSYAPTKLNEVQGRFVASNRVYNFILNKDGISYSPAGQGDSLLFSALFLRQDAARKPKVGNDKCNAGKSYQCGKICLGNRRKCHKGVRDVNDARRIASILASTNEKLQGDMFGKMLNKEVSIKAYDRGRALFGARGKREKDGKPERVKNKTFKKSKGKKEKERNFNKAVSKESIQKNIGFYAYLRPENLAKITDDQLTKEWHYHMLANAAIRYWDLFPNQKNSNTTLTQQFLNQSGGEDYRKALYDVLKERGIFESADNTYNIDFAAIKKDRSRTNDKYKE
jgi:hypothetical protein